MPQEKKYDLKKMLAEIEDDLGVQDNDMEQQLNISQSVIASLMIKKVAEKDTNNNSRDS